jgi:hypothetical protein
MVLNRLENLQLRGFAGANTGVASAQVRNGFDQAGLGTPTMPLSLTRHLPGSYPRMRPGKRPADTADGGTASAARRAGRPGCSAGVLVRCGLAITARRAIQSGWPRNRRGAVPALASPSGRLTGRITGLAARNEAPSGHREGVRRKPLHTGRQEVLTARPWACERTALRGASGLRTGKAGG